MNFLLNIEKTQMKAISFIEKSFEMSNKKTTTFLILE